MKRSMIAALVAASLLAACGGGDSGTNGVTAVKVVGASLADTGTFGFKFTVQASAMGESYRVYPEWVAQAYNLPALCSGFLYNYGSSTFTPQAGCTNLAVAGAGINYGVFTDSPSDGDSVNDTFTAMPAVPASQLYQLQALGAQGFSFGDLLIVGEGSANDTATLVTAFLTDLQTAGTLNTTLFSQVVNSLLDNGEAVLAQGPVVAGTAYMEGLAKALVDSVRTNAIQQGARRVLILNTLDVTRTPRFEAILAGIGETQATNVRNLVRAWINAYNTALVNESRQLQGRVEVFDFYSVFNTQLADPAAYGLTNLTQTVCDETYAKSSVYTPTLATAGATSLNDGPVRTSCTDTYASSIIPSAGTGTAWWTTYLFADNFHPTPRGHELLGNQVNQRLRQLGWL